MNYYQRTSSDLREPVVVNYDPQTEGLYGHGVGIHICRAWWTVKFFTFQTNQTMLLAIFTSQILSI